MRCPECGSTNAGEDRSQSGHDLAYMLCNECEHGEYCGHWQVKFDWNVESELIGDDVPEYLEPLAPGDDLSTCLANYNARQEPL